MSLLQFSPQVLGQQQLGHHHVANRRHQHEDPVASPSIAPTSLSRSEDGHLIIEWSDGRRQRFLPESLLDHCPCATCREKHGKSSPAASPLNILASSEVEPVSIQAMAPVGNYAYSISFSRGCNKGIYTFEYLLGLGDISENDEKRSS